jgi:hypothetical protein
MSEPISDSGKAREADAEFVAYITSRYGDSDERKLKKQQEEERHIELCRQNPIFYRFNWPGFNSCTTLFTRFKYHFKVGTFKCEQCKSAPYGPHWGYPHLDPVTVLTAAQLRQLRGRKEKLGQDNVTEAPETRSCIARLEDLWQVPITAGTRLGPCRPEIGEPPTYDIGTVMWSGCIFARRWAVQALLRNGFEFDFVELQSIGIFAKEADFVQLVVPVIAHQAIHSEATYCSSCRRVNEDKLGWTSKRPEHLYFSLALNRHPFFSTIEHGNLFLSPAFVEASAKLGIKGLVEGITIQPWPALPDPLVSRPEIFWTRAAKQHHLSKPVSKRRLKGRSGSNWGSQ